MKVVVGLGNPGEQYAKTRHNVGWMVVDRLADRAGWAGRGRTRDASAVVQGRFHGLDLVLAKPLTFMNDSGVAVRKLVARERAPLHELLVVTDDFSLPFGKMRFREGGSHGGQTGDVQSAPADELRLLVVHGGLHLCGWDHAEPAEEVAMRELERAILAVG